MLGLILVFVLLALPAYSAQDYSVLFLQSHDETYDLEGKKPTTLRNFYNLLGENGISVASLNSGEVTSEILISFNALVITYPKKNFTAEEIGAIESFVANGGGLVILGGRECREQVNPLIERFGISIEDKVLSQNNAYEFVLGAGNHEIFRFVNKYQQVYLPSIRAENGSQIIATLPFLPANEGVIAAREYGAGKVIVAADADFLNDRYLANYDNAQLGLNIINYALGREIALMKRKANFGKYALAIVATIALLFLFRRFYYSSH